MTSDTRPRQNRAVHTHKLLPAIDSRTSGKPGSARHAADKKAFLVIFVVVSHVIRCFKLVHKALSSPFSAVFLFSVATIFQFVSRGVWLQAG